MKIAACYIRVSTDDQLEYSPDSQLEKIREFAKRNDYLLPDDCIFIEEDGVSGRKAAKRHEFQRMINTAKKKPKPFDVIIVWKFSRFARNREDSIVYKSMLRKELGIEVVSVSENIGDDKMSVITEAIIEAMDEYYSINLGEEVRRGMTEKAKRGEYCTTAPYGYRLENKKLVVVPEQAEIIREVFVRHANGWTLRKLAEWLTDSGVVTKRGGKIENRTVEYWLNNPVYHGYCRWTPTGKTRRNYHNPDSLIVKGSHEPIIDDALWEQTQEILKKRKEKYVYKRRTDSSDAYTLRSILRCSNCGSALSRSNGLYMQCIGYAHGTCKVSHSLEMSNGELLLLSTIRRDLTSGNFRLERGSAPSPQASGGNYPALIARAESKLERAKEAYMAGIDTLDEYKVHKEKITAEIAELREKQAQSEAAEITPEQKREFAEKHLKTLEKLTAPGITEPDKNALLKSFIKTSTYNKADKSMSVIYLY